MEEDKFYSGESEQSVYKEGTVKYQGEYQQENTYPQGDVYQQGAYQQDAYQQEVYQQGAYQQGAYLQNTYQQMYQEPQKPSQVFGIVSMILGIVALVFFCSCINLPLAVIAIILGIIQLVRPESKKGMAITGIITSAASILLFIIMIVAFMLSADFKEGFAEGFEQGLGDDFYYNYDLPEAGPGDDTF